MRNRPPGVRVVGCFVPLLGSLLVMACSGGPAERIREIHRLAGDSSSGSAARIARFVEDRDPSVRATALSEWSPEEGSGVPDLLVKSLEDPDGLVRSTAARRLGEIGGSVALLDPLLRHLREDADWRVRQRCADALGSLGVPVAADGLARASVDPEATVRSAAIRALARSFPALATDSLSKALAEDSDWKNRVEAAAGLRRSGSPAAYGPLTLAKNDPNEFVRAAAADGLRELDKAGVAPPPGAPEKAPSPRG